MRKTSMFALFLITLVTTAFTSCALAQEIMVSSLADLKSTGLEVMDVSSITKGVPPKKGYKLNGYASFIADPAMIMAIDTPSGRVNPSGNKVVAVDVGGATLWVRDGKEAAFFKGAAKVVVAPAPAPVQPVQPVAPAAPAQGIPAPVPVNPEASTTPKVVPVASAPAPGAAPVVVPADDPLARLLNKKPVAPKNGVTEAELREKFRLKDLSTTSGGKGLKPREGWLIQGRGSFIVPDYAIGVDTPDGRVGPGRRVHIKGKATLWLTPEGVEIF